MAQAWGPALMTALIRLSARTCRWRFVDCDGVEEALRDPDEGLILLTPHENVVSVLTLGLAGWPFRGRPVASIHPTIAWIHKVIDAIGVNVILVDKHDRATSVADDVKATLAAKDFILLTPDGPLGPAHKFDPGIWMLARKNKAKVMILSGFWTRSIRANTWDRQKIPLPFSTCYITGCPPFYPGKEFGGLRAADVKNGTADPDHPAVRLPREALEKLDRLERQVMGRNL